VAIEGYTLEQAEAEIAELRGLIDVITEAHTKADATDAPDVPASGLISYSSGGQEKYTSADGNAYTGGQFISIGPASNTAINAAWAVASGIPGFTVPAGGGVYHFHGKFVAQMVAPGSVNENVGLSGPATNYVNLVYTDTNIGVTPPVLNHKLFETSLGPFGTAAYATSAVWEAEFTGNVSFSAGGTFQLAGGTNGSNFNILAHYGHLIVIPIV
jgi:hypothetical protein